MPELKRTFTKGKMNKDVDERMVPKGEYVDALNIEINTSEGSDVGTVQALKGNVAITSLFGSSARCVGTIVNESNNKLYWFITDPTANPDASVNNHTIYSNYIIEYDENINEVNYILVSNYKVVSTISQGTIATYFYITNITGLQVGMSITTNNQTFIVTYIEDIGGGVYKVGVNAVEGDKLTSVTGAEVVFENPVEKCTLGFNNISLNKLITGINIVDDLLFWTDGISEPKKINIERCKYGSQQASPSTYPNGTRALPTLLIVNGEVPNVANGRIHSSVTESIPVTYKYTTVIKKSPTKPLVLTMSNTVRAETALATDGQIIVESLVSIPFAQGSTSSSNFFFTSAGNQKSIGTTLDPLTFPQDMDWSEDDIIEFYPEDDDAGDSIEVLATLIVDSVGPANVFTFEIQSISKKLVKPITTFTARLKQEDPLFQYKFPRFAYRWKYEDGEYSAISPFSEVAFIPSEFDYLPKKGYNLGMTNNLRKLILSDFKPQEMPLDVVDIDVLYKESNSPNVYTVKTIKSPSAKNLQLSTNSFDGDEGWFGKIDGNFSPRNDVDEDRLVCSDSFVSAPPNGNLHAVGFQFPDKNIMVGDKITFTGSQTLSSNPTITVIDIVGNQTYVGLSGSIPVNSALGTFTSTRVLPLSPAVREGEPAGSLRIKSDMIHATLPSNQMLRPWDNVPIKALAQDVTKNRIVYGNYTQNYNLEDEVGSVVSPTFKVRASTRANIRENIRYDDRSALRDENGATVVWYDVLNRLEEQVRLPERSIKSIRDYQFGIVFSDEYGRQTPVQTHESGILRLPKERAADYNNIRLHLNKDYQTDPDKMKKPHWATHYKYYVKENSNEYYNLAMDRFYSAEDGNVWLSFPSSERNKVDEETFLILKKQHDNDVFVSEPARYKILAIENEAPLFIKTKIDSFGILGCVFGIAGEPKYQATHVDIPSSFFTSSFQDVLSANERVLRVTGPSSVSNYYDIASITNMNNGFTRCVVRKSFGVDMSFTTDDGTNAGNIASTLSIELATKKVKTLPEFLGRFFVKIYRDGVFEKNVLSLAPGKEYVASQTVKLGQTISIKTSSMATTINRYKDDLPKEKWFISKLRPADSQISSYHAPLPGLRRNQMVIQNHFGGAGLTAPWGITKHGNNFNASNYDKDVAKKFTTIGQLFRFKGDTSIYKITGHYEFWIKNYKSSNSTATNNFFDGAAVGPFTNDEAASNHSVGIRVDFEVDLDTPLNDPDAVSLDHTGYDPRHENTEGTTGGTYGQIQTNTWQGSSDNEWGLGNESSNPRYHRTIEFLEEFVAGESYTSDNPAIWETEPKENVDLDIYREASQGYAIDREWNAFKNKFEDTSFWRSWNATNYYNCFSFANGVESNRLRDDYNAVTIDKGPKASAVLAEQYKQEHRASGLIYSGLYNSTTGINNLNQFIQAEKITKDLNPTYGSIQKLYAKETNLNVLCEDRIIKVLANKDALYNADGNTNITSTNNVLGAATPYSGDYGISKDPESFASDQYRSYFTDRSRGVVIRLSNDGVTPISEYGMSDYFGDILTISNSSLIGSFDENKSLYNLTITPGSNTTTYETTTQEQGGDPVTISTTISNSTNGETVSFSETQKGWSTFQSWQQDIGISFNQKYFTFKNGELYIHHENETRNNFYGVDNDCSICFVINDSPESVKNFSSLSYEGSKSNIDQFQTVIQDGVEYNDKNYFNLNSDTGWSCSSIETDLETGYVPEFKNKEGKWFNFIKGNKDNTLANLDVSQFSTQGIGNPTSVSTSAAFAGSYRFDIEHKQSGNSSVVVSTHSSVEAAGDNVNNGTLPSSVQIVFTPMSGKVLKAASYSYDPSISQNTPNLNVITNITFADSGVPLSITNTVIATINISSTYTMPSNDELYLVFFDAPVQNYNPNFTFNNTI